MTSKLLIIDADSAVYACGFICEKKEHYGILDGKLIFTTDNKNKYNKWLKEQPHPDQITHDFTETLLPFSEAKVAVDGWVKQLMQLSCCTRYVVLLTKGGSCFRTHLATLKKYKGNRDKLTKPTYYDKVREYLFSKYKAKVYVKWEADDTARMSQEKVEAKDEYCVIANIDKDLEQIACLHVNPNNKDWGVYQVTEMDGAYSFYKQMLMGDTSDNIPGLKGVGAKSAEKMLADCTTPAELCSRVHTEYIKHFGAKHTYTRWWWLPEHDDSEDPLVLAKRKRFKKKEVTVPVMDVFRENADLLYMLRSPTDQYVPEDEAIRNYIKPYPKGVVHHVLGD